MHDRQALLSLQDITELYFKIRKLIEDNGNKIYTATALKDEAVFRTMVADRLLAPATPCPVYRIRPQHWETIRRAVFEIAKLESDEDLLTAQIDDYFLEPNYGISVRTLVVGFRPFITGKGHIGRDLELLKKVTLLWFHLDLRFPML